MHETSGNYSVVSALGFWSSIATAIFAFSFSILMGFDELSGTFSYSLFPPTSHLVPQMILSFFIPFTFLVMSASVHVLAPKERKIFSLISVALASAGIAVDATVFYTQLSVILPHPELSQPFIFSPGSFEYATEFFGCTLISLSALSLSFVFHTKGIEKWIKSTLLATGLLSVPIALSVTIPWFWFNLVPLWGITLPGAGLLLAVYFFRKDLRRNRHLKF